MTALARARRQRGSGEHGECGGRRNAVGGFNCFASRPAFGAVEQCVVLDRALGRLGFSVG